MNEWLEERICQNKIILEIKKNLKIHIGKPNKDNDSFIHACGYIIRTFGDLTKEKVVFCLYFGCSEISSGSMPRCQTHHPFFPFFFFFSLFCHEEQKMLIFFGEYLDLWRKFNILVLPLPHNSHLMIYFIQYLANKNLYKLYSRKILYNGFF